MRDLRTLVFGAAAVALVLGALALITVTSSGDVLVSASTATSRSATTVPQAAGDASTGPSQARSTTTAATSTTVPPEPLAEVAAKWDIVFSDEFDAGRLDSAKWVTCYWWNDGGCSNEGNNELEWYQPGNVVVQDGVVALEAREEEVRASHGARYPYTSGMITTGREVDDLDVEPGFSFTYGYVEVRARVPSGKGLWPALWLLAADHRSRPEIDILEVLGDTPAVARFHVHYLNEDGDRQDPGQNWIGPDLSAGWHVYGLEWTPDHVVWFIDGTARWEVNEPDAVPHEAMYLIANLAVGGEWPGAPDDDTEFPAAFLIDYVRIWQGAA